MLKLTYYVRLLGSALLLFMPVTETLEGLSKPIEHKVVIGSGTEHHPSTKTSSRPNGRNLHSKKRGY